MPIRPVLPIAFAAAVLAVPAAAQPSTPVKVELTYAGVLNALHLGEVKVLSLHVVEHAGPSEFRTDIDTQSYGVLRALKLIDIGASATGPVAAGVPMPHVFSFASAEKTKTKRVTLTWTMADVTQTPPHHDGGNPPPTPALKLGAADPVTVFSRAVYAPTGQALCAHNWRFYDGAQIYELQFQPAQTSVLTTSDRAMGLTAAVTCQVRYAEVAGFTHKPGDRHGDWLKEAISARFGKLGAAGPWIFEAMKADTFLGYAQVELTQAKVGAP
ncbi:MAG TPA: hypothetical protein VGI95_06210 [Caulobacteraceae bacterium]